MSANLNIHTYYSSQTEALIQSLLHELKHDPTSPVHSPFGQTQILVPNSGMQRYVELKIAEAFGICSHIDISYIGQLTAQTYRTLLDNASPASIDERLLTFAILRLWKKQIEPLDTRFQQLKSQYKQPRQRYLFANKIAKLLRQYLNDRPEMIDQWQAYKLATSHPHEAWQCNIFQQLMHSLSITHHSRLDLQQRFITALADEQPDNLTTMVHVFGFHSIPSTQLTDLLAIGQATQVVFYTFNPSIKYWQDIVPEKLKTRLEITQTDTAELMSVGHPLLASWGQSGKYLIEQLGEFYAPNLDEMVELSEPNSVLTWLQNDIHKLREGECDVKALFEKECKTHVHSISLHACANPRREVEVLYDNLCELFETSNLNPADVLVIVPKLGDYAPHIQAIFSRSSNTQHSIPYSLANQSSSETEPDVQAFLSLLDVLDGDFQAQLLFEVLSEARIQEALKLSQSHLDSLRNWFADSRFSVNFYDDSDGERSSLEKLLDSLLLAAIGGEGAELDNRQASLLYHGGQSESLTQLCQLWQYFTPFIHLKNQSLTLSTWRDKLRELTDTFLPPRHAMDDWLNEWHEGLEALTTGNDKTTYDFATIRTDLSSMLQNNTLHGPFLSGGVSFCAVIPMRSIPAKMVAILGLDNNFPAISAKNPLDLTLEKPRWSDRNPHKEQQYFFLETLMATREKLYLSHVGLDEKTGEAIPPSALVRELFGYLERHLIKFSETVTQQYPLQGFVSENSYQSLYNTPKARETKTAIKQEAAKLPETLTTQELTDILLDPLAAFWRYNLGAEPVEGLAETLTEHEFITTEDGLDKWQYKQSALNSALHDDSNTGIRNLQQENLYAPQAISEALLSRASADIQPLVDKLEAMALPEPQSINETIKVTFSQQSLYLRLKAHNYPNIGLISYHTGKLDAKKMLHAWITHVMYHTLPEAEPRQSMLLTLDDEKVFVPLANNEEALTTMNKLLNLVHAMIQQPYPVTMVKSGKRAETALHYEACDISLYSQTPSADEDLIAKLQAQWLAIDGVLQSNEN